MGCTLALRVEPPVPCHDERKTLMQRRSIELSRINARRNLRLPPPSCVRAFHVAELSRQRRFVLCVVLGVHEAAAYGVVASTVLHRPEDCKRQTIADMVAAHSVGASECASAYPTTARRPRRART